MTTTHPSHAMSYRHTKHYPPPAEEGQEGGGARRGRPGRSSTAPLSDEQWAEIRAQISRLRASGHGGFVGRFRGEKVQLAPADVGPFEEI